MANEEAKKTTGRGGWRGGGRPVTAYKVPLMVRISQEAADKLAGVKNKSEYIDELIKAAKE
jgi:hypothetical protein